MATNNYSILTVLTLDAVGFNQGVDKAKQKTADLAKGTEAAAGTIKKSFGSLSGMFGGLTNSLNGIQSAVMGGIGAFKNMIPAINGVKTAFMATGIGAIVIALSAAFASLASYLGSTKEGASKLKEVFSYVSGAVTAVLNRVQLLGSSIVKLFKGDFAGAGEDIKKAFASGLLAEIKETAEANNALYLQEKQLTKEKREFAMWEADNLEKMTALHQDAADFENFSAEERLSKLNQIISLEEHASKIKSDLAKREYDLLVAQHKLKQFISKDDQLAEIDAYVNWKRINSEENEALRSLFREKKKLSREFAKGEGKADLDYKEANMNEAFRKMYNANHANDPANTLFNKNNTLSSTGHLATANLKGAIDSESISRIRNFNLAANELARTNQTLGESFKTVSDKIGFFGAVSVDAFGAAMEAMSQGGDTLKDIVKNGANAAKQMIAQNLAVAASQAIMAVKGIPFPLNIVAAGLSMAGILALGNSLKFANGGIVPGSSYYGDKVPALVNSGEMILNAGQQANLFSMLNSGGGTGGNVRFEIEGSKLVGVLNNHNRKQNSYR